MRAHCDEQVRYVGADAGGTMLVPARSICPKHMLSVGDGWVSAAEVAGRQVHMAGFRREVRKRVFRHDV